MHDKLINVIMKRKIVKGDKLSKFISLPQKDSGIFELSSDLFKFYAWLISHEDGYDIRSDYFISKGVKIDSRSIGKYLKKLSDSGWITISQSTITICPPPISQPTNSPLPISPSPISLETHTICPPTTTICQPPIKTIGSQLTNKNIKEKEEEKKKENVEVTIIKENFSQFCVEDSLEVLKYNYTQFKSKNNSNIAFSKFEEYYAYAIYLHYMTKGLEIKYNSDLQEKVFNTNSDLIDINEIIKLDNDNQLKLDGENKYKEYFEFILNRLRLDSDLITN